MHGQQNIKLPELSGPVQAYTEIALPFVFFNHDKEIN
jgi:hypothetical protein